MAKSTIKSKSYCCKEAFDNPHLNRKKKEMPIRRHVHKAYIRLGKI